MKAETLTAPKKTWDSPAQADSTGFVLRGYLCRGQTGKSFEKPHVS